MGEWTLAVSAADRRVRTPDELAELLPALSEVMRMPIVRMGEDGRALSAHAIDPRGIEHWVTGELCDPGTYGGHHPSYQIDFAIQALPDHGPGVIAAELYEWLRADGRFEAVLMSNDVPVEATHIDRDLWWK